MSGARSGPRAKRGRERRPPAKRNAADRLLRRTIAGDRLYVLAFLAVVTVIATMAVGPLQNYTAAADRVDALEQTRDRLRDEVRELEQRERRLQDPEVVESLARSQLGLVKPGEIPLVVVAPEEDPDQVRPAPAEADAPDGGPWHRRLGRALLDLFDADDR